MKNTRISVLAALSALAATASLAGESASESAARTSTQNKNITVVSASASSDGSSEITREKVQDCIISLPDPDKIEAQVSSASVFVHGVGGVAGRNEWVKSYSARLDVTYLTREKDLIIVTTRSIQGQPPVFREVEKLLRHTETFLSNSTEGDTYGGRSNRQYYFTTREAAINDVKSRARVWISQQVPAVCPATR
jgi:hypothetical protein